MSLEHYTQQFGIFPSKFLSMYMYIFKNKIRMIPCILFCVLVAFTHIYFSVSSSLTFCEHVNVAVSYVNEAYVIYLTYQFEFLEKTQISAMTTMIILIKVQSHTHADVKPR
jgi:hypothetical protein